MASRYENLADAIATFVTLAPIELGIRRIAMTGASEPGSQVSQAAHARSAWCLGLCDALSSPSRLNLAVVQAPFMRKGSCWQTGALGASKTERGHGMSEDMSRRRALSLLGLGAAFGLTLSAALEPSEAEAQEAAPPAAPAEASGTHGMKRRQSRRHGRHERRHGRHERRHERRTGEKPEATAPAGTEAAPK